MYNLQNCLNLWQQMLTVTPTIWQLPAVPAIDCQGDELHSRKHEKSLYTLSGNTLPLNTKKSVQSLLGPFLDVVMIV